MTSLSKCLQSVTISACTAALLHLPSVLADSSGPRLAAYYDRFMAICGEQAYVWTDDELPRPVVTAAAQVAVGKNNHYVLTNDGRLLGWVGDSDLPKSIIDQVKLFRAGRSGLLIIREDDSLWHVGTQSFLGYGESVDETPARLTSDVLTASVGDGADYYVTLGGELFVKGLAHRGQYGDGALRSTDVFVTTAAEVSQVSSHTGHVLLLKNDGSVWGAGGNIYGPLGRHGIGDKASAWGKIFDGAASIATGSSHSVAIRRDNSLWIWGRNEGLDPKRIKSGVIAVAASSHATIALSAGGLWQWNTGEPPRRIMACP